MHLHLYMHEQIDVQFSFTLTLSWAREGRGGGCCIFLKFLCVSSSQVLAGFIGVLMAILCVASVVERTQGKDTPPVNFVSPLLVVLAMVSYYLLSINVHGLI